MFYYITLLSRVGPRDTKEIVLYANGSRIMIWWTISHQQVKKITTHSKLWDVIICPFPYTCFWHLSRGCRWVFFSRVMVTFDHVGESFFFIFPHHHRGCLNNTIFSNLGSCAACWARFMCQYELWATSVSHPSSSLNSYLGLAGGNITRKLLSLSLDSFFKILLFQVAFLILFFITRFSPYFLLVGLLLQYVALFQSRN